jgi:hypothetical protein
VGADFASMPLMCEVSQKRRKSKNASGATPLAALISAAWRV